METHNQSSEGRTPLFPAYSAPTEENEDAPDSNIEWLNNSSYIPATNKKEIVVIDEYYIEAERRRRQEEFEKRMKKLKKKEKKEFKSHAPIAESYHIAEKDSIRSQLNKKTFIEETGLSFERAFRVDQNGDFENNHYDCLEKKKIASYKRFPEVPVGCSSQEKSVWLQTSTNNPKKDIPRYFSKKALKLLLKTGRASEVCTLRKVPGVPSVASSFISLVQLTSNNKNSTLDRSKANFDGVSLSWKSTESEYMDESESKNMDENKYDSSFKSELKNKTILFNQRVRETPHDIQLWLDFVNFQEEFYSSQKSDEANELVSEQYIIDKKIAILDKALKHNPKNVQLNIEKLKLGPHIWKRDKVISCWDELLFLYPNNAQIWKEYIIFILTNLTYFSIPRVLKIFSKCIRTLSDLSEGIIVSHQAPPDIINNMLDIFNQLGFILKSCGYTEKAIAAFQALIEFNLFSKQSIESLSVSEQIICFEPFWDSGAARFGEDEAIGWATTVEKNKISFKKLVTQSDLSNTEEDILYQKYPEWKTWLKFERLRESHHWLPWRPNPEYDQTEDDIDDIDRTISFDDISKFIFRVSNEEHKFLLLHNFLTFLGFNPHLFGCYNHSSKEMNCQITIVNFDILSKKLNDSLFNEQDSNPLLFKTTVWNAEHVNFMKNVFSQAKDKFSFRYKVLFLHLWLKYLQKVALECNIDAENMGSVQKFAKNILKEPENRNCLLLWFEYIKIESCCGSKKKAKKTTETLFSSSISAVNGGCMPIKELWYFVRSYIDFSLNIQESCVSDNELFSPSEIIWLLIHIGCKEKYVPYSNDFIKPTQILKAVSGFKSFLNEELSSMANTKNGLCYCLDPYRYSLIDCIKCFAYLQYFTQGLDAAVQVLNDSSETLGDKIEDSLKKYIQEQVCVFQAELLNFHTRNSIVSMKPLLLYLYDSVKQYPSNSRLLHILIRWRNASLVVSPTRRFFADVLKGSGKTEPITWIFALASELSISYSLSTSISDTPLHEISPPDMGIKWKIRSLYEKALDSLACEYIPILWQSYIKFEMLNNEIEKSRSIFHRAVQNCGWSKELIMSCVEYFSDDLKQMIDYMVEKHIRIHTPLEEIQLLMEHGMQS